MFVKRTRHQNERWSINRKSGRRESESQRGIEANFMAAFERRRDIHIFMYRHERSMIMYRTHDVPTPTLQKSI